MKQLASHSIKIVVSAADIDEMNHVNNVVYLKWIQDIAKEHWLLKASTEIKQQFAWVVVSHLIEYKRPCFLNDQVTVKTQVVDDATGATWGRNVWIYDAQDQLAVQSHTKWCMVDIKTQRPRRITDDILSIFISE
ncbi:MAG: acyl-CoA thioesterase [Cyclobacteriaceae bacterium]